MTSTKNRLRHPQPDRLLMLIHGHWAAAAIATAVSCSLFTMLESRRATAEAICREAHLSPKGGRALLGALVGLGLLEVSRGRYRDSPLASAYLVEGKPFFLGHLSRAVFLSGGVGHLWLSLPEAVRAGSLDEAHWRRLLKVFTPSEYGVDLVDAIREFTRAAACAAARHLAFGRRGPARILDIGGGAGVFSEVFLGVNRKATALQVDFPVMNGLARLRLDQTGLGGRFETLDGDFRRLPLEPASFDVVIYSNLAHFHSQEQNSGDVRKAAGLLKDHGTLVFNDYLTSDDGTGDPLALLSGLNWLFLSQSGRSWPLRDVKRWLRDAGLRRIVSERAPMVTTLVYGQKHPRRRHG